MAKLVPRGQKDSTEVELGKEPLTIGRKPENRLMISDQAASGKHAVILLEKDQFYVEDLKSSNGTFVNAQRITSRQLLKNGDIVMIGRLAYEFQDGSADLLGTLVMMAPPKPQAPPKPVVVEDNLPRFIVPPAAPAPRPAQASPMPPIPPPPPAAPAPAAHEDVRTRELSPTDVNMLDQLVGSIRSHRDREAAERAQKAARTKTEWDKTLVFGEQMRLKVTGDPRIKYFGVSAKNHEIMIRYQRDPKAPIMFMMLALYHPEQAEKDRVLSGIWLRRTGEADRCLQSAEEAAQELVRELAFLLA